MNSLFDTKVSYFQWFRHAQGDFFFCITNRRTDNGYTKAKEEAGQHNSEARGGSEEALGGSGEASRNNNSI